MEKWRERKYIKLSSRFKNWEKIPRLFNSSLSNCKNGWILWTVLENSMILNQIRFQSTWNDSKFSCSVQPRQKIAAWYMESIPSTGKRFWKSNFYVWFTSRFSSKNFTWRRAKKSRSSFRRSEGKNKSDKWRRTKLWRNSNADVCVKTVDCEFSTSGGITAELRGRTAKTANIGTTIRQVSPIHHHFGVENKIQNTCLKWFWFSVGSYVVDHSWFFGRKNSRDQFMERIFQTSRCWTRRLLRLWTRSSRIPSPKRRSASRSRKPNKKDRFLRGKQIAFMIYDYFRVTGAHDTDLDFSDLCSITLRHDNVQEFDARWDEILLSMTKIPFWSSQKRIEIVQHGDSSNSVYEAFDARRGRIESGAVNKNRKGMKGVEGGKGISHQWKDKGQCSQGDRSSFRHDTQDRAQKPEHTAAISSEPTASRGRSVSRKRSIRGKSNHGSILRQPCKFYLKGTCTRTPCEYVHSPECQIYKTKTGCKSGNTCLFPHPKVDEQPIKGRRRDLAKKKKKDTSSKRTTRLHSSRLQKSGFSLVPQQESLSGESVCSSFRCECAYGQSVRP